MNFLPFAFSEFLIVAFHIIICFSNLFLFLWNIEKYKHVQLSPKVFKVEYMRNVWKININLTPLNRITDNPIPRLFEYNPPEPNLSSLDQCSFSPLKYTFYELAPLNRITTASPMFGNRVQKTRFSCLTNIKFQFFPANTACKIQPLDN